MGDSAERDELAKLIRELSASVAVNTATLEAMRRAEEETQRKLDLIAAELNRAREDFRLMGRNMRRGKQRAKQRRLDEAAAWEPAHPYLEDWNRVAARRGDLRRCLKYTPNLVESLKAREREAVWVERWPEIVDEIERFSADLLAERSWFDLSWLAAEEDHYVRLLEGRYRGARKENTRSADDGSSVIERTRERLQS